MEIISHKQLLKSEGFTYAKSVDHLITHITIYTIDLNVFINWRMMLWNNREHHLIDFKCTYRISKDTLMVF